MKKLNYLKFEMVDFLALSHFDNVYLLAPPLDLKFTKFPDALRFNSVSPVFDYKPFTKKHKPSFYMVTIVLNDEVVEKQSDLYTSLDLLMYCHLFKDKGYRDKPEFKIPLSKSIINFLKQNV